MYKFFSLHYGQRLTRTFWLLWVIAITTGAAIARPTLNRVAFYQRVDGTGYSVWFFLTEKVAKAEASISGNVLSFHLYNTDLPFTGVVQDAAKGPISSYNIIPGQDRVTINLNLTAPVSYRYYPDISNAMILALSQSAVSPAATPLLTSASLPTSNLPATNSNAWQSGWSNNNPAPVPPPGATSYNPGTKVATTNPAANTQWQDPNTNPATTPNTPYTQQKKGVQTSSAVRVGSIADAMNNRTFQDKNVANTSNYAHSGAEMTPEYNNPKVTVEAPLVMPPARTNAKSGNKEDYFTPSPTTPVYVSPVLPNPGPTPQGGGSIDQPTGGSTTPVEVKPTVNELLNGGNPLTNAEIQTLKQEAYTLAQELVVASSNNEKKRIEAKLDAKLAEIFSKEQEVFKNQINDLKAQLLTAERGLAQRVKTRTALLTDQKNTLLTDAKRSYQPSNANTPYVPGSAW